MSKYCQGTQRIKIIKQLPVPQVDGGRHLLQTRHRGSGQIRGEEGVRVDLDYSRDHFHSLVHNATMRFEVNLSILVMKMASVISTITLLQDYQL